jgi:hypothetical protein
VEAVRPATRVPRLTKGKSLARQLQRLLSKSLSRRFTVLTTGGALCLAVFGTAAFTGGAGHGATPTAAPIRATVAAYVRPMIPGRPVISRRPVTARRTTVSRRRAAMRRHPILSSLARATIHGVRTRGVLTRRLTVRRLTAQRAGRRRFGRGRFGRGQSSAESGTPRQLAELMLSEFGWSSGQFSCLDSLWMHESGWNVFAENPSSGAYGIPQALPASQMASAGSDWQTDAATQIRWGLGYIQQRYGSPCGAWGHEVAIGWY